MKSIFVLVCVCVSPAGNMSWAFMLRSLCATIDMQFDPFSSAFFCSPDCLCILPGPTPTFVKPKHRAFVLVGDMARVVVGGSPLVTQSNSRVAVALEVFTCVGGRAPTTYTC